MRSTRLCVPMSGCSPPGAGTTPSVASHQATPSSRLAAAMTMWSTRAATSEPHFTLHAGHASAADPGLPGSVALHVHTAGAAQCRPLAGHVVWRSDAGANQPLRERRIEAARHRVLSHPGVAGEEGPHFEGDVVPGGTRAHHATL